MRRADKEVKDLDQLEEILRACTAVRIGVRDERGMFIVPMSYGYALEGEKLTLFVHSGQRDHPGTHRSGGEADGPQRHHGPHDRAGVEAAGGAGGPDRCVCPPGGGVDRKEQSGRLMRAGHPERRERNAGV